MSEAKIERLKISMPEVIPAPDGSIPLTVTLDLRGIKIADLPVEVYSSAKAEELKELKKKYLPRPIKNKICPKANEIESTYWLSFTREDGGYSLYLPLDRKPGKWVHKYPVGDESFGDGEDQGIELIYHSEMAAAPEEGKINTYQLDLRHYLGHEINHLWHFTKIFFGDDRSSSVTDKKKTSNSFRFRAEFNEFLRSNAVEIKFK